MPFSRVIEVELSTKQMLWKYQEKRVSDFFSPRISNAQRLPNGNTLIREGATSDGCLRSRRTENWFGNMSIPTSVKTAPGSNNCVFRAYRYGADEIARAKATEAA